ncbi:hypothetical protein Ancab_021132 [Ancistrocladus abbreviatus]
MEGGLNSKNKEREGLKSQEGSHKISANLAKYNCEEHSILQQQRHPNPTNGLPPVKSYAEAVLGSPGGLQGSNWTNKGAYALELKALESDIQWLEKCFVGELYSEDDVPRFLKLGILIQLDDNTRSQGSFEIARMLISTPLPEPIFGCVHIKADDDLFLIQISEEVDYLSSSSGRTTNNYKVHLSVDSGNTVVHPWTNSFIPDTNCRSQKGYLHSELQATYGKAENEKPGTSACSLCLVPAVSPTPNTKAAYPAHNKVEVPGKCQTLHGSSSPYSFDKGTSAARFQFGDELGPDGPSGSIDLP